jgi:hypothetical protein
MNRTAVDSSTVAGIGYDNTSMTLEVAFTGGTLYQYFNVPRSVYRKFMKADSKGQFFNAEIRDAYPYRKVH